MIQFCPGDISPYQQYLSCYWPDLDQTLNKGSWEHILQITTVTMTFVQVTFVHISNISISKLNTFDFSLVSSQISQVKLFDTVFLMLGTFVSTILSIFIKHNSDINKVLFIVSRLVSYSTLITFNTFKIFDTLDNLKIFLMSPRTKK